MNILRRFPIVASLGAALLFPTAVLAATGNPPPNEPSSIGASPPWGPMLALIAIALGAIAISRPWTRRWIAAGGSVMAGGVAAFVVVFAGTFGGWNGRPPETWTVPGALVAVLAGLVGAAWILRRGVDRSATDQARKSGAQRLAPDEKLLDPDGSPER